MGTCLVLPHVQAKDMTLQRLCPPLAISTVTAVLFCNKRTLQKEVPIIGVMSLIFHLVYLKLRSRKVSTSHWLMTRHYNNLSTEMLPGRT